MIRHKNGVFMLLALPISEFASLEKGGEARGDLGTH